MYNIRVRFDYRDDIKRIKGIIGRDQMVLTDCYANLWKEEIQSLVPPPYAPPGWNSCCDVATGNLQSSFYTTHVSRTSSFTTVASVMLEGDENHMKAYVHEYGAIITPKKPGGLLVFNVPGKGVVHARRVKIRAKNFLSRAFDNTLNKLRSAKTNPFGVHTC